MRRKHEILAEVGSVHDGSFGNACMLIDMVSECGATGIKFQTHLAEYETLPNAPMPEYFIAEPRLEYFQRTAFSLDQWVKLIARAHSMNLDFISSPFSNEAVDLLERTQIDGYKVASGEVSNIPLLERLAQTKKPIYLSSGMSNMDEIAIAVHILANNRLVVMQCSSVYPCPSNQVGVNVLEDLGSQWSLPLGFSDHTMGMAASVLAIAKGAVVIEKHVTFSRRMYGSDALHSMEPYEFKYFTETLKEAWDILAHPVNKTIVGYHKMRHTFQKSIVLARDVKEGTVLSYSDLAYKKPGDGIPASEYLGVVGQAVNADLPYNHKLNRMDFK